LVFNMAIESILYISTMDFALYAGEIFPTFLPARHALVECRRAMSKTG
jgi:hypothetical protein